MIDSAVLPLQELLEAEAQNAVPIEDEIEQARAKVDARTPITHNVSLSPPALQSWSHKLPLHMLIRLVNNAAWCWTHYTACAEHFAAARVQLTVK